MPRMEFHVIGVAQPQGSAKAFIPKGWTRPIVTSDNPKNKCWRELVAAEVSRSPGVICLSGAVNLEVHFALPRPKSLGRKMKPHLTRPDLDKTLRSLADAITGICYRDDSQVTSIKATKNYAAPGQPPSAHIIVEGEA